MRNYSAVLTPDPEEGAVQYEYQLFPAATLRERHWQRRCRMRRRLSSFTSRLCRTVVKPILEETVPIQVVVVSVAA